jgi:spore coat polysaccharide biosynthesis predicted glycosyltransferase SpsG
MVCRPPGTGRARLAADAGAGIGLGHLRRTLALAAALARHGYQTDVLTPPSGPLRERVERAGLMSSVFDGWPAWDVATMRTVAAAARVDEVDFVVIDTYQLSPSALAALRRQTFGLVMIDDLARGPFDCDIIVNGGPAATALPYPPGPRRLLGPDYALLGPEFWERGRRECHGGVSRVLVTVGASAAAGVVARLVPALQALALGTAIDVVVGPFTDPVAVARELQPAGRDVRIHQDVSSLRDLALATDLAISAAGHTVLELAWAGCPTIAFAIADNQEPALTALHQAGVVQATGRADARDFVAGVRSAMERLCGDAPLRGRMTAAGQRLVDGRGALRVAEALSSNVAVTAQSWVEERG